MKVLDWFTEPINKIAEIREDSLVNKISDININNTSLNMFEPDSEPDTRKIEKIEVDKKNKPFRPSGFNEYIGQNRIKKFLKLWIQGLKKDNEERIKRGLDTKPLQHILISGLAGTGKTTLAQIIADMIDKEIAVSISSEINDTHALIDFIMDNKGKVIFLDEIHSFAKRRDIIEAIYSIMEDFKYGNYDIEPFTLIGATTELGEMIQKIKPFVERFKIPIELDEYSIDNMTAIGKQYCKKSFPYFEIKPDLFLKIAENARKTPRLMIRLVESCVYFDSDIKEVLNCYNIVKLGFTKRDFQILRYIGEHKGKGVGLQALCSYMQIAQKDYLYNIEPYLLQNKLIHRLLRGRAITEKGKEFLNNV